MQKEVNFLNNMKGKLIVSCQALPDEPLHSSFIMGRMAQAANLAGASGIRANSVKDIQEIKRNVNLPIIGIIKQDYDGSDVFITPTMTEIDALYKEGIDMIALDATSRIRPDGTKIDEVFPKVKEAYPDQLFMADCATYDEAMQAAQLGFDCVSTTLHGYTAYTENTIKPNIDMTKKIVRDSSVPVIAEGGIWTPEQLKNLFDVGIHAAVVGSAITRPMEITQRFLQAIKE